MTIVYRTAGAWGAGVGRRLTKAEGDGNLFELVTRVSVLEGSIPAGGVGISSIDVTVDGQMTITLTDASSQGPFPLPTTTYPFRGLWAPSTSYLKYDHFTRNGNLYEVLVNHVSQLTFSPTANDGAGHDYYALILANPGASLPTGGATGSFMVKQSNADFDFTLLPPGSLTIPFLAITGVATAAQLPLPTLSNIGGVKALAAVTHKFLTSIGTDGIPVAAQPSFADISGTISASQVPPIQVNSTGISSTTTLDLTQANTYIQASSGSDFNVTIPPHSSVAWVTDTEITFRNSGVGLMTLIAGAGVTINIPAGFLAKAYGQGATITAKCIATDTWDIFGLLATV